MNDSILNTEDLILSTAGKLGGVWNDFIKSMITDNKTRLESIKNLICEREASTSMRTFKYDLENNEGYYVDTYEVHLFSNGICAMFSDTGNVDHNSNDHRVGVYNETAQNVTVRTISIWREEDSVINTVFLKPNESQLVFEFEKKTLQLQ